MEGYTQFKVRINIGNEAMLSQADIAQALRNMADKVEEGRIVGTVHDANGNACGTYALV